MMDKVFGIRSISKLTQSKLVKNTLWMLSGQGLRLLIQAAYFSVIARSLGTANYGAFIGAAALVGIASPFGALGSGNLLIRDVARDPSSFRASWGRALVRTVVFGSLLIAAVTLTAHFALPADISHKLVLLIAMSDIIGLHLILIAAFAFQAFEDLSWTSGIYIALSVSRLFAALVLVFWFKHPSTLQWAYAYFASTMVMVIGACCVVAFRLGTPQLGVRGAKGDLREGLFFAASTSAQTVYTDLDKTMLARLGSLEAAGIYGAAYRVIEVSFTPIISLLSAAYPSFFRIGADGIRASLAFAKPLVTKALLFSCALCLALILFAGLLPVVLGKQYADAAVALRWLALILPFRSIHAFFSDVLTSIGRQGLRTFLQVGVALVNALVNLWLIPAFSWKGAAWSSVGCDALLAIAVVLAVRILSKLGPLAPLAPPEVSENLQVVT